MIVFHVHLLPRGVCIPAVVFRASLNTEAYGVSTGGISSPNRNTASGTENLRFAIRGIAEEALDLLTFVKRYRHLRAAPHGRDPQSRRTRRAGNKDQRSGFRTKQTAREERPEVCPNDAGSLMNAVEA